MINSDALNTLMAKALIHHTDTAERTATAIEKMANIFEVMAERDRQAANLRKEFEKLQEENEKLQEEVQRLNRVAREARGDRDDLWNQLQKPMG